MLSFSPPLYNFLYTWKLNQGWTIWNKKIEKGYWEYLREHFGNFGNLVKKPWKLDENTKHTMGSLKREVVPKITLQAGLHCPLVEVFNLTNIMKEIFFYYIFFLDVI